MRRVSAAQLLRMPVRLHGIQLARPIDVIFDRAHRRALGIEVLCGDDEHRFLPLSVSTRTNDELVIRTPLVLLDSSELAFYTEKGSTLGSLRGRPVEHRGEVVGTLDDVVLDDDGVIAELLVATSEGRRRITYDRATEIAPLSRQRRLVS